MPDRPVGRGLELSSPPVALFAKEKKIPFFQTENINRDEALFTTLSSAGIDLIVVLAFAQFLGTKILELPRLGCFNIHTSILPKYRGAAPIQYALLNGDKSTGVSIQKMVKEMDAGDLVSFHKVDISENENGGLLYARLKFQAALSTSDFILDAFYNRLVYTPQNKNEISFAPTLSKEDGHLDFKKLNCETIKNKIRALDPWPGTFCFLDGKRLKIIEIEEHSTKISPGITLINHGMLIVGTTTTSIRLSKVQLEGKKVCSDTELLNGLKNKNCDFILS
jgi:methionyl-tRNA formyltransferase